ncbi:ATP-binding protein [Leptospira licerasiae]|uniref:histidine kinase n=1 Tax=Leptospira licerasiae str. MMD4847 TaxID=1049971 RepID=A0ABN0HC90_9LEPT|nr:ATP-binding protein [Leptospira licerasiae]EIE01903.1 histidine kinase A domain / GHKL domain multi-domain protein [Leptospira licerasiae serovar Varillal str. VAR 010]EJZ43396.1 GHKL domain protein [Leptospira licerasiae str. MMD4847]
MLSYDSKLRFGVIGIGFLGLLIGFSSWISSRNLTQSKDWESHTFNVISRLENLASSVKESKIRFLVFINSGKKEDLEYYKAEKQNIFFKLGELKYITRDNSTQQNGFLELEKLLIKKDEIDRKIGRYSTFKNNEIGIENAILENDIDRLIDRLKEKEVFLLSERTYDSKIKEKITDWVLFLSISFNILILAVLYRFLKKESDLRVKAENILFEKNNLLEHTLFEKEKFYKEILMIKSALDCASSNIMIADNDLNVVYTNRSVVNMFQSAKENIRNQYPNFSPEALIGSCIDSFHSHPERQRQILSTFTNTHKSSISIGGRQFNLSADPVIDSSGERLGSVVEWLDVTERNLKEFQINQLNRDLEENIRKLEYANRELEAFSYSVSHDLRAPIRGIDGFTKIMLEDYSAVLEPEALRILNVIATNSKFMGQLIDDLLAFYRVSKLEPKSDSINMKHMVSDSVEIINQEYGAKSPIVQISELPPVKGDASMLKQVWLNLISNAYKYSSRSQNPFVEIGFLNGEGNRTFFVKDNGVGFDDQYSHKLFKVFQRLHSNEEFNGTGIGLAIVDRIVQRHGGKVWAEGKMGQGATFYFTIPNKE